MPLCSGARPSADAGPRPSRAPPELRGGRWCVVPGAGPRRNDQNGGFDGNYSVDLDCDDGDRSNNKGNSSISTLVYVPAGTYELRHAYSSGVSYPGYDPVYLCGA